MCIKRKDARKMTSTSRFPIGLAKKILHVTTTPRTCVTQFHNLARPVQNPFPIADIEHARQRPQKSKRRRINFCQDTLRRNVHGSTGRRIRAANILKSHNVLFRPSRQSWHFPLRTREPNTGPNLESARTHLGLAHTNPHSHI